MLTGIVHGDCLAVLRDLPDNSVDALVTDPPYGLSQEPDIVEVLEHWLKGDSYEHGFSGFSGKSWDSFVPGPEFWREVARVMKPGAHGVIFSSTRTQDLLGVAVRMAKLEIRDTFAWAYASGYPKSLDVGKAFDFSRATDLDKVRVVTRWLASVRDEKGLTNADLNAPFGFVGMSGHWTTQESQPLIPTAEQWPIVLGVLGITQDDVPEEVEQIREELGALKGTVANERPDRVTREFTHSNHVYKASRQVVTHGSPVTERAQQWDGWGTGLKPCFEPALIVRKHPEGTTVQNIEKWGCGAININGSRIPRGDPAWPFPGGDEEPMTHTRSVEASEAAHIFKQLGPITETHQTPGQKLGRWPANVRYCPKADRAEREAGCSAASMLCRCPDTLARWDGQPPEKGVRVCPTCMRWDRQPTGAEAVGRSEGSAGMRNARAGAGRTAGAVWNHHPTVKPISVMRWLLRLLVPPGGVVLDPFGGSGTTAAAAEAEGFRYLSIEKEAEYIAIARARARHWAGRRQETAPWAAVPRR